MNKPINLNSLKTFCYSKRKPDNLSDTLVITDNISYIAFKIVIFIADKRMGKLENLKFLRECFSGIGSDTPDVVPIPLYFFNSDHGKAVLDYLINSVIKQYSLFEYIHAEEQDELIVGTDVRLC